jgi:hypothetical protein
MRATLHAKLMKLELNNTGRLGGVVVSVVATWVPAKATDF